MAGTVIHDENLVKKHEQWIGGKVSTKLFWTIMTAAFAFTASCWLYAHSIDEDLSDFKTETAKTVITKADLDTFKKELFQRLDRMEAPRR